jgi:hypothetical protein
VCQGYLSLFATGRNLQTRTVVTLISAEGAAGFVDLFSGKPLCDRIDEKRVLLYSVAEEGIDDGGDIELEPASEPRRPLDLGFSAPK